MRLYVALLGTLTEGQRTAQAMHAVAELALCRPAAFAAWHQASNTVVAVTMDATDLARVHHEAVLGDAPWAAFREPDLGMALTAVAMLGEAREMPRPLRRAPLA